MDIHHDNLSDIQRYIENNKDMTLEKKQREFDILFSRLKRFKDIDEKTRILEIGPGTGWFTILCEKNGVSCKGLEISPALVRFAKDMGQKYGVEPDIKLGNVEDTDLGISQYDIVIADTVFEHVEHWQNGLKKVFLALKQGGILVFVSTNKFSLKSTEYNFPMYGWLPDRCRYKLRQYFQGEDIMKLGIDFNQFTYFQLRRFFKKVGFSHVMDWTEYVDTDVLVNSGRLKRMIIATIKWIKPLKPVFLFFMPVTSFICRK